MVYLCSKLSKQISGIGAEYQLIYSQYLIELYLYFQQKRYSVDIISVIP
jgi:hypothetical protein